MEWILPPDPIIVIGADSSGTTMLVRILEQCDVCMGSRLASNYWGEPEIFFKTINGFTDAFRFKVPIPSNWETIVAAHRNQIHDICRNELALRYYQAGYHGGKWGFKDPRNTFTAPVFLDIYPKAVILHIIRDGLDVAESRMRAPNFRRENIMEWMEWWQEVVSIGRRYKTVDCNYEEIRYEDICLHEPRAIDLLARITDLEGSNVQNIIKKIAKPGRMSKLQNDLQTVRTSQAVTDLRKSLGYG
jgi:hypothetical protein